MREMTYGANTILVTNRCGAVRRLSYHPQRTLCVALGSVVLLVTALLYSGFQMGRSAELRNRVAQIEDLRDQTLHQYDFLQSSRQLAQNNLDALTMRLGRIQAQLMRLDALGERLVSQADLDSGEFDFSAPPPLGGPSAEPADATNNVPDFLASLDSAAASVQDRSRKLRLLERLLMFRDLHDRGIPSGLPVKHGQLTSRFGMRTDPFTGKPERHKGIDIAGQLGTSVLSVADGIVIWAGKRKGYGNLVEIDHGNGYITRYGHNEKVLVQIGDTVHKGEPVALMGSTGRSTGPHVHLEVLHNGRAVNPAKFLHTLQPGTVADRSPNQVDSGTTPGG
jgi:murein DD-endopeptidase MepM/ murein hydrolase activator NlpD